jgi:hypothetical protein
MTLPAADIHKRRHMLRIVHIDRPAGVLIQNLRQVFTGWMAVSDADDLGALRIEIDDNPVDVNWWVREDVGVRLQGLSTRAWSAQMDLERLDDKRRVLTFDVLLHGTCVYRRRFLKSRALLDERHASPLFFMHVPKAAGTSFRQFVDHIFQDLPNLFVYGHFPGITSDRVELLRQAFRDSRELVYGHIGFNFIQDFGGARPKAVLLLRDPHRLVDSYRRFAPQADTRFLDNPYVRHLAGAPASLPYGDVTQAHFEQARSRLDTCVFPLAITQLQSFADRLTEAFDLPRFPIPQINRNDMPTRDGVHGMPARLQFDEQVYAACMERQRDFFEFLDA